MRCDRVQEKLNAFWDGELPVARSGDRATTCLREEIENHLQDCLACRQEWVRLQKLADILSDAFVPAVPEGFAGRVLERARQRVAEPRVATAIAWNPLRWWAALPVSGRVAAAAVLVIGVAAGTLMGWQTGRRPSPAVVVETVPQQGDDPVAIYNLDYLGSAPDGSLPKAYLTLVAAPREPGE